MARHDRVDVAALEHLALQQRDGERLQGVAILLEQAARAAHGQVGELLLLLVQDAAGGGGGARPPPRGGGGGGGGRGGGRGGAGGGSRSACPSRTRPPSCG